MQIPITAKVVGGILLKCSLNPLIVQVFYEANGFDTPLRCECRPTSDGTVSARNPSPGWEGPIPTPSERSILSLTIPRYIYCGYTASTDKSSCYVLYVQLYRCVPRRPYSIYSI